MKKTELLLLLLLVLTSCAAQENKQHCAVVFYNVENLFDTVDDPATMDDEFTPTGRYRYTHKVYQQKLHNIATVINELDAVLVGLAEIENNTVLKDLTAQPELQKYNYKYAWYNSPDPRGIDVALLYNPTRFKVMHTQAISVRMKGLATRDILYVKGVLDGDTVHVHVNHWPSRGEGMKESMPKRRAAAIIVEKNIRSILAANPKAKIIVMGDLNDNPDDESISKVLGAKNDKTAKLYNPWTGLHQSGKGTSVYNRKWDHFDQVIISKAFLQGGGWQYDKAEIYDAAFIRNKGFEDAYPLRSFKGYHWNNGYSDHLPVILHLRR